MLRACVQKQGAAAAAAKGCRVLGASWWVPGRERCMHHDGADGGFQDISVMDAVAQGLDSVQSVTNLPWWVTLAVGAVSVRGALFPISLKGQNAMASAVYCFKRASLLSSKEEEEETEDRGTNGGDGDSRGNVVAKAVRALEMMKKSGPHPAWIVVAPLLNVSVLFGGLYSVRKMAAMPWPGFEAGGPPWAPDLTLPAVCLEDLATPLGACMYDVSYLPWYLCTQ